MGTAIIKIREKGTNTVPEKFRKHTLWHFFRVQLEHYRQ